MGSSNFKQHNPTETNQLSDADFASNSLTSAGIGTDNIMPSNWMNKRWYQDSTFIAALAQALANKGYNVSDADIATLEGVLANILTNADIKPNLQILQYSPTPTFDASTTNGWIINLNGNVTSSNLINVQFGQILTFVIQNPNKYNFVYPGNVQDIYPDYNNLPIYYIQQFIVEQDGNAYPLSSPFFDFIPVQQNTGIGQITNNAIKMGWDNTNLRVTVGNTDLGGILFQGSIVLEAAQSPQPRGFNQQYQNTSGGIIFVSGYGQTTGSGTGQLNCMVGPVSPSQNVYSNQATATITGGSCGFAFMVPPGFFYKINVNGAVVGVGNWVETVITI